MRGTSLYLKHFRLTRIPFRQQPDPEVFFAEAGRDEILQNLCADVAEGKPLIKLTGSEGTGKTLLHLLLARKLGIKKFEVIRLDHPVGSFEDLLRMIYRSLSGKGDQDKDETTAPARYLPEVLALLRGYSGKGSRVVLLVDEAEQLFPATLERLVRLIAEIDQEKLLQVVLAGRPELDRNLQQLSSYCDKVDLHTGYALVPLDSRETAGYLSFRLVQAGCPPEKAQEVFSDEAISSLYQEARGNLSLTNMLAEQALVKACDAGMFRVGPEVISFRQGARSHRLDLAPFMVRLRKYRYPVIAGSFLALALLLFALRPEQEAGPPPEPSEPPVATVPLQENAEPAPQPEARGEPVARGEGTKAPDRAEKEAEAMVVAQGGVPAEKPVAAEGPAPAAAGSPVAAAPARETLPEESPTSRPPPEPPTGETASIPVPEAAQRSLSFTEPVVTESRPDPQAAAAATVPPPPPPPERKMVVLQADARKKKVAAAANGKQPAARAEKDPGQLVAERTGVRSKWKASSGFTIQLMALASENAEENFRDLLAQKRYAAVKDQLYVVRKAVPPTLFVYYGFYETMEEARRERDRLPDFLQKNHPYPLTIDQAANKAKE